MNTEHFVYSTLKVSNPGIYMYIAIGLRIHHPQSHRGKVVLTL